MSDDSAQCQGASCRRLAGRIHVRRETDRLESAEVHCSSTDETVPRSFWQGKVQYPCTLSCAVSWRSGNLTRPQITMSGRSFPHPLENRNGRNLSKIFTPSAYPFFEIIQVWDLPVRPVKAESPQKLDNHVASLGNCLTRLTSRLHHRQSEAREP
ncbi:hypothetical protein CONLIGDRAFT_398233 [Coniochaeta ligniaria NRRL 30616]|uniref:Uncharacterized protein n=1 Tax=Coniochaeta ligniaria NRRL 30616 TaxID=1408157 RepID=A0A1J7J6H8_9PEZI|nr:hypothetical protein CONLIGDRAFT_398233 [Coniochaeta ligniaria NRRL 30616]